MSELPKGWTVCKLQEAISDYQAGFASGKKDVVNGLKHLRMNNITVEGRLNLDLIRTVPVHLADGKHLLQNGDVIVCTTNSANLVGKCALFDLEGDFAFSNHLTRLRVDPTVLDSKFLLHHLWLLWRQGEFEHKCNHWVNQSTIPKEELLRTEISLPPLSEQRRIVAKLEKLLSHVDAARARLAMIPLVLKRFRQSVLAAACSGRLTAGWRSKSSNPESLETRIARIRQARLALAKSDTDSAKITQSFKGETLENETDVPGGWLKLKAKCICDFITKGTTPNTKDVTSKGDVPFLKVQHIINNKLDLKSLPCFVPKGVHDNFLQRSKVYPRDVLMNIVGPPLNKVAIVPDDFPEWNINQALAIFRPVEGVEPEYLQLVLSYQGTLEHLLLETRGIVGQSNISLEQCRELMIPVPPLNEQQEIIRTVEALFKTADALEARYRKAKAHLDKLTQSILSRAFRGELVPQDPNDEPAYVLLERIQRERLVEPKKRRFRAHSLMPD